MAQRSSRNPAQRSALLRPRPSAAIVRSSPCSSSSTQTDKTRPNMSAAPCARRTPRGTGRAYACGLEHPVLRSHRHCVQSKSKSRVSSGRVHDRANRLFVGSKGFQPAHQHFEESFARRLLGHIRVATREDRAVDFLYVRGKDGKCRAEFGAQLRKLDPSPASDFCKANLFEGVSASRAISASMALSRSLRATGGRLRRRPYVYAWICGP